MLKLKIQLFGGRGRRGLGTGAGRGPGIGIATAIYGTSDMGKGKLPEKDGYPDFPDPDYSKYLVQTNDKFINDTYSLMNYKRSEHDKIGAAYLKSLNINPYCQYSNKNDMKAFGYVSVGISNGKILIGTYNLNKADTRRMEYKVKTMFHEGYHAKNDGLPANKIYAKGLSENKISFHEETRTEMSALYLANKLNGYDYVPSYTLEVIGAAAKYKRLEEFKDCKTLYDLGERFYKDRMVNKENPSYKELEERFKKVKLTDNYYTKYYNIIKKNKDKYYECCKNSLFNWEYYDKEFMKIYNSEFDSMIKKISSKEAFTFDGTETHMFAQCVALAMNEGGIL